jgi:hypothetical protein
MDGNLECLYHGWQFNGAGTYVKNPQVGSAPSLNVNPKLLAFKLENFSMYSVDQHHESSLIFRN